MAPDPLEYHVPTRRSSRPSAIATHIRVTISAGFAWMALLVLLMVVVPRFAVILKDFGGALTPAQRALFATSDFLMAGGWLYSAVFPIAIVGGGLLIDAMSPTPTPVRWYARLVSLLLMLFVVLAFVGVFALLYLPLLSMVQSLLG